MVSVWGSGAGDIACAGVVTAKAKATTAINLIIGFSISWTSRIDPALSRAVTIDADQIADCFFVHSEGSKKESIMKVPIALSAILAAGFITASTETADAVIYCQYISYPAGCVARPGVVLRARPVARAAVGVGVTRGAMNRGGPVNRVGRR